MTPSSSWSLSNPSISLTNVKAPVWSTRGLRCWQLLGRLWCSLGARRCHFFPQSQHGATGTVWMLALCLDVQPQELYLMWLLRAYRYSLKEFDLYWEILPVTWRTTTGSWNDKLLLPRNQESCCGIRWPDSRSSGMSGLFNDSVVVPNYL